VFTDHDGQEFRLQHSWNETPNGLIVDSTAWAFEGQALPHRYERDPEAWARLEAGIGAMAAASTVPGSPRCPPAPDVSPGGMSAARVNVTSPGRKAGCGMANPDLKPYTHEEAKPIAAELVAQIERDYLAPGTPEPLAWEFRTHAMKLLQGALVAEHAWGKPHAVGDVTGQLRGMARRLVPTIEQAASAVRRDGVLRLVEHGYWAAGLLYELTGKPMRPAPGVLDATAVALKGWLDQMAALLAATGGIDTRTVTRNLTSAVREAVAATPGARAYGELRIPVVRAGGARYGRLDVVIWHPDLPDIVVEIDFAPNAESVRKLEFARDAGAVPIWIRHGSGRITEPEGVAVIDVRPSIAAAAARDQEAEEDQPAGQADTAPARLEASRETAEWLDAQIKALGELPFRVSLGIDDGGWNWRCDRPDCQGAHYVGSPELQAAIGPCTAGRPPCPCCR